MMNGFWWRFWLLLVTAVILAMVSGYAFRKATSGG